MKILLVGEYSRLHNSLKAGLTELGHDVKIAGNGDGFKGFPVDITLDHPFRHGILKKFRTLIFKLTSFDIGSYYVYLKTLKNINLLSGFDVVQLINESALQITPKLELRILKKLLEKNKYLFLLSAGIDYTSMSFMLKNKLRYSVLTPLLEKKVDEKEYKFQLHYLSKSHKQLNQFLFKNVAGIIASDLDYHIPLVNQNHRKYLGLVPNPIILSSIDLSAFDVTYPIKIFHGVNREAYIKKGNRFFDEALEIIQGKFSNMVEITRTTNIPYKEYIDIYDNCHILLDQVYAYDQGYNALEAMAKGKVVFTGAEREWLDYYELEEETVAINALPNAQKIADKLEWLILNPDKIIEISINARKFVEKEHDHIKSAQQYLDKWASVK